jgi:hypothetical protein
MLLANIEALQDPDVAKQVIEAATSALARMEQEESGLEH